ncbi:MAG TPA: hypothetical protein VLN59_14815 [Burkholderiales bacterium]|nr:hypothetical protein [Burkholderiales bacterium]
MPSLHQPCAEAAILAYLDLHSEAVDSVRGIISCWLKDEQCDPWEVQRALDRLVDLGLVERIILADGTAVYGKGHMDGRQ